MPRGGRLARARGVPRHLPQPDGGFDVEQLVRRRRGRLRGRPRSVASPIPGGGWNDGRGGEDGGRVRRIAEGVGRVREVARRAPLLHPPGLARRRRHADDTRRPPPRRDRGRWGVLVRADEKTETSVAPISSARGVNGKRFISLWAKWVEQLPATSDPIGRSGERDDNLIAHERKIHQSLFRPNKYTRSTSVDLARELAGRFPFDIVKARFA